METTKRIFITILLVFLTSLIYAQNNCLNFDGINDVVQVPHNTSLNMGTGDFTVEAWVNTSASTPEGEWPIIVSKDTWGTRQGFALFIAEDSNTIAFEVWVNNNQYVVWGEVVNDGNWHHVVGRRSGNTISVFKDGIETGGWTQSGSDGNINVTDVLTIGQGSWGSNNAFDGLIDEVRIWSDARSVSEIRQNMFRELNGNEDNLVAYYKSNEGSDTDLYDATSNSNDGELLGMSGDYWVNSGAFAGPRQCLDFDGTDAYIESITAPPVPSNATRTLEAWVKIDALEEAVFVGHGYTYLAIGMNSSGQFISRTYDGSSGQINNSGYTLETGKWYHLATVFSGGNSTNYVNGVQQGSTASCPNGSADSRNYYLGYGYITAERYFDGQLDEVRIWDDVRTEEEIREYMCRTIDGDEDNLLAYYRFDQQPASDQTTLYDITSNENNGTLNNMDATSDWVECIAYDTWIGWHGTLWRESKNWSRGVPTSTDNVGIHKWTLGHAPTIETTPGSAKTLVIGLFETLTLDSGLSIYGNLFELGELTHNDQTVICAGSGAQYLVGSLDFYDLTINNSSADKKVSAWWTTSLQVDNTLTVNDGIFYSKSDYDNVYIGPYGTLELSGDVTVSGNWGNDGTFIHNDHKVTFDGSTSQTIYGDITTTFYDLTIDNSSGVVIAKSSTVDHTLDFNSNSKITLGSWTLTIGASGSIVDADANNYIVTNGSGVLTRNGVGASNVSFPIGNSAYNPVIINNSGTADNFSVKVADDTPSNINDASRVVNRTWTITEDTAGGSDVTVSLQWNSGETGGNFDIEDQLVMGRYLGSGTSWETKTATGSGSNPFTAEASGFASFSDFAVASGGSGTLPVELSAFTAQYIENTPTIYWSTQSETDNMGWFICRSDEDDFSSSEVISEMIEGHGTTTEQQFYTYEDNLRDPQVGDNYYYWLESIDYSGIINHYDRVAILTIPDHNDPGNNGITEPEQFGLFQNEPNPVISSTRISFNLRETSKVDLTVYNLKGQLVKKIYSGNTSKHIVTWDGKDDNEKQLENGVYFYTLTVNGKTEDIKKLILMR